MKINPYINLLIALGCSFSCSQENRKTSLSFNQIQVIGSHNSYKVGIEQPLFQLLVAEDPNAVSLDYYHYPISDQLNLGLRGLELDVIYDPNGGRYNNPKGFALLEAQGVATQPYDDEDKLSQPGMKVFHIPDIDFRSHCLLFADCLTEIKHWSDQHADHLPIIITINPKNDGVDRNDFTEVIPFDKEALESLDQEILKVLGGQLITPSLIQGIAETLRSRIIAQGWPPLDELRGKIMFVLDAGRELTDLYLNIDQQSRLMFVNVDESHPQAAFFIMNDPKDQEAQIRNRVEQGFMVRTRADADTKEAITGDLSRFEAAIRSGAQVISTDYYLADLSPDGTFSISFEGEIYQKCNQLLTEENCEL